MQNIADIRKYRRALDDSSKESVFDQESGLAQRRLFRTRIDRQWDQCLVTHQPLSVLLIRIDHMPPTVDESSPPQFLDCLRQVGHIITEACRRRADFAGRMRSREIGVMLAESYPSGAQLVADRIQQRVEALKLPHPDDDFDGQVTVSIGGASTIPKPNRFASSLLIAADSALQDARVAGGNCVVLLDEF